MIYGDEEIIKARVAKQAALSHAIGNEVKIEGISYTFEQRELDSVDTRHVV